MGAAGGTRALGEAGEALAAASYERDGYTVLAHNFRTRQGEIDLVLRKGEMLVFAEVKTRTSEAFTTAREAVTPAKQRRLVAAAGAFLAALGTDDLFVRFDVAEVVRRGTAWVCLRSENAFDV